MNMEDEETVAVRRRAGRGVENGCYPFGVGLHFWSDAYCCGSVQDMNWLEENLSKGLQEMSTFDEYRKEVLSNLQDGWTPVHKSVPLPPLTPCRRRAHAAAATARAHRPPVLCGGSCAVAHTAVCPASLSTQVGTFLAEQHPQI